MRSQGRASGVARSVRRVALAERSLLAMAAANGSRADGTWPRPGTLARAGPAWRTIPPVAILYAVRRAGRAAPRETVRAPRAELTRAQRLRPGLTYALPHLAVQARIELARVYLALSDLGRGRTLLREVDELLMRRPGLGILVRQAADAAGAAFQRPRFERPREPRR